MKYNAEQLAALVNLGIKIATADGKVVHEEIAAISSELKKLGVTEDKLDDLFAAADSMSPIDALITISKMNEEKKRYATGFLAVIIAADGEIADSELKQWQLMCTLGGFPPVTMADALLFWKNN